MEVKPLVGKRGRIALTALGVMGAIFGSAPKRASAEDVRKELLTSQGRAITTTIASHGEYFAQEELDSERSREKVFSIPEDILGNETIFKNNVFITIDDCVDFNLTEDMFTTLHDRDLRATFFPNTVNLRENDPKYQKLWREIRAAGFDIGYHTQNHVAHMTEDELNKDFSTFEAKMRILLGDPTFKIQLVRPPGGNWDTQWKKWVHDNGLTTIHWTFVPSGAAHSVADFKAVMDYQGNDQVIGLFHPRAFDDKVLKDDLVGLQELADQKGGKIAVFSDFFSNDE